jgi:hypothetical protein
VNVERSDDGGITWRTVRGCSRLAYPGPNGSTVVAYDHEAPIATELLYRARSGREA